MKKLILILSVLTVLLTGCSELEELTAPPQYQERYEVQIHTKYGWGYLTVNKGLPVQVGDPYSENLTVLKYTDLSGLMYERIMGDYSAITIYRYRSDGSRSEMSYGDKKFLKI